MKKKKDQKAQTDKEINLVLLARTFSLITVKLH